VEYTFTIPESNYPMIVKRVQVAVNASMGEQRG
jgi:hypothetical protein